MQTWAAGDSSALPFGFYVVTLSRIVREWPRDGQSESLPVSTREAWTPQAPGSLTGVTAWQTPTQLMSQNHEVENGARARLPAIQAEQSKRNERRPQWQFSRTAVNFPGNRCSSGWVFPSCPSCGGQADPDPSVHVGGWQMLPLSRGSELPRVKRDSRKEPPCLPQRI